MISMSVPLCFLSFSVFVFVFNDPALGGTQSILCAAERPRLEAEPHKLQHHSTQQPRGHHFKAEGRRHNFSTSPETRVSAQVPTGSAVLVPGGSWRRSPRGGSPGASLASVRVSAQPAVASQRPPIQATAKAPAGPSPAAAHDDHGSKPAGAHDEHGSKPAAAHNDDGHGGHGSGSSEHGEEHHHLGEGVEEQEKSTGFVAGMMLLTFAISLMGLLFLLNYPDPQVHSYSWKLLSHIISILCALMFEKTQDHLLIKGFIIPLFGVGHGLNELWCAVPFLCVFFSLRPLCFICRNRPNELFAVENIMAHLAAFIAVEMFTEPLEHIGHKMGGLGCILLYLMAPVFSLAMFFGLRKASAFLCERVLEMDSHPIIARFTLEAPRNENGNQHAPEAGNESDHGHHSWEHAVSKGEIEASAIVFGFLIKEIGEALCNQIMGNAGAADEHGLGSIIFMIIWTGLVGASYAMALQNKEVLEGKLGEEMCEMVQDHLAMSISWCIATTSKWTTYWMVKTDDPKSTLKSLTVRKMVNALWLTPAMVGLLIGMDALADAGRFDDMKADSLIAVCGLVTGISWEQCYASTVTTVGNSSSYAPVIIQTIIGFGLVAALVPGWMKFIVPKARAPVPPREVKAEAATPGGTRDSFAESESTVTGSEISAGSRRL